MSLDSNGHTASGGKDEVTRHSLQEPDTGFHQLSHLTGPAQALIQEIKRTKTMVIVYFGEAMFK